MSKAVTSEEVEDVLSSIRRLVSEDKRPLAGLRSAPFAAPVAEETAVEDATTAQENIAAEGVPDAGAPAEETQTVEVQHEAERFVLTPALRVQTPAPESDDGLDDGPLDLGSVARETWTQDAAEDVDAPEQEAPMMLVPEAKLSIQDPAMDALDALVHEAIENEVSAIEDELDEGDYGDEGFWEDAEDDTQPHEERSDDVHNFEGDDRVENEANWDLQEDADTHNAEVSDTGLVGADIVDVESINETASEKSVEEAAPDEASAFFEDQPDTSTLSNEDMRETPKPYIPLTAKIAALEAVIGGKNQDYEPDGDEADELAAPDAPAMAWEDDVELDAKGEPFVAPVEEVHEPDAAPEQEKVNAGFATDDQVMDEEALRDLVSEIVRAELQGALGERITRNVRKLVRREIHRALTAQEME